MIIDEDNIYVRLSIVRCGHWEEVVVSAYQTVANLQARYGGAPLAIRGMINILADALMKELGDDPIAKVTNDQQQP